MRVNIVDVVSKYVELSKRGPGYIGMCPFCGASGHLNFIVSERYQKYSCKKCGVSGGIFQFLMDFKNVTIEEALDEVKETFNISISAHFLDSRWRELLQESDFQQVLNMYKAKHSSLFGEGVLIEEKRPRQEETISYTKLATFIRCQLEYKLRFLKKAKGAEPTGIRVNLGRFLHLVAYNFLKLPAEKRRAEYVHQQFKFEIDRNVGTEYSEELKRFEEPTSILLLQNFAEKTLADKNPHFMTRFSGYNLIGSADCLIQSINGIEIIEFKENDYRDFDESSEILNYLQLLFYYFGLRGEESNISGGAYCFFNNGSVDHVNFSKKLITEASIYIKQKLDELSSCKIFTPKPNRLCISCGYRDKCEQYRIT